MQSNKTRQIGITGGIGSGKSVICRIFRAIGVPVYDADERARELMLTDRVLIDQIKQEFGKQAYFDDGRINRKLISDSVFGKPDRLNALNRLVHPRVREDYYQWLKRHQQEPYVIREAALIFEAGVWDGLDKVLVVSAPEELRIERVLSRDTHRTREDVERIMKSQMPESEKLRRADFIIYNDETRMVIPQVLEFHNSIVIAT